MGWRPQATLDEALRAGVGGWKRARWASRLHAGASHLACAKAPAPCSSITMPWLFLPWGCSTGSCVTCHAAVMARYARAPQLWHSWRPNRGNVVHAVQLRIACAGATRLAEGGLMVYSTCSLNPVEDEARGPPALLQRAEGGLELVDWPGPAGVAASIGTGVMVGAGRVHGTTRTLLCCNHPQTRDSTTCCSPRASGLRKQDGLHLERCWRLFPHTGNSGGFFVALLRRTGKALPENFEVCDTPDADAEDLPEDAVCKDALPASPTPGTFSACGVVRAPAEN